MGRRAGREVGVVVGMMGKCGMCFFSKVEPEYKDTPIPRVNQGDHTNMTDRWDVGRFFPSHCERDVALLKSKIP